MKKSKKHLLRAMAAAAEDSIEEAVAEVSGYASAEVMRAALAKALFNDAGVKKALVNVHKKAREQVAPKIKPRDIKIRKLYGRVQAPRLQPRGNER